MISSLKLLRWIREKYILHRYSHPLFILKETINAFKLHNGLGLSASLSFYAILALIPMALLMFFLLSHIVVSSDHAMVRFAIITSNLLPKLSQFIMLEVYEATQRKAFWGIFGLVVLLWLATPLAGSLRSAFYTITAIEETNSFFIRKLKDVFGVIGILIMFFMFTLFGVILEDVIYFFNPAVSSTKFFNFLSYIVISTSLITIFYRLFFPARVAISKIFAGSFITACLWIAVRPIFSLFLSSSHSYGYLFGGMKNTFISIGWLYYSFVVFLFGTELISTLHKSDVLLLRNLFIDHEKNNLNYIRQLYFRYGKRFNKGEIVFKIGQDGNDFYYIANGKVGLYFKDQACKELAPGDYFGEIAIFAGSGYIANAIVSSESAELLVINADLIRMLISNEPKIAIGFLRQFAVRLQSSQINFTS